MSTTYTQKLRASIAYNTDDYLLNCDIPGIPALELKNGIHANAPTVKVEAIAMDRTGALVFYMAPNSWEYNNPTEAACKKALEWINDNFDKLFPEA